MLSHPDPETQEIVSLLQAQRDEAIVRAGRLAGENDGLKLRVAELNTALSAAAKFQADALSGNVTPIDQGKAA